MLGPALQRLFDELNGFAEDRRSVFENQLHHELLGISQSLEGVQRIPVEGAALSVTSIKSLAAVQLGIGRLNRLYVNVDLGATPNDSGGLGAGGVPTSLTTRCSRADCPNKRDK